ncbi:hypothetical protein COU59_00945 [Candidatus Pacearchaeota archaeon CG10_big_fil_rev_8_21_14_0_10_34_12]|nr:MAG: hypothetical protein COU59_00945 [Candidatus Pacearchaeota archaeon CG10_big_fil_rev_8_21_14_0_10_34_12]
MLKEKKGGTHVGVILSFVIFITFVAFLYSVLIVPNLNQNNNGIFIESIRSKVMDNTSSELYVISIKTEQSGENCIKISNFVNIFGVNSRIIVRGNSGEDVTSYIIGSDLEISRNNNNTFFKIYNSEHFESVSSVGETPCETKGYETGVVKKENYVFEDAVKNLVSVHDKNYTEVKQNFNVPEGVDFGIGFTYGNRTLIETEKESFGNIYSSEFPVQYIDGNSNIKQGTIKISAW